MHYYIHISSSSSFDEFGGRCRPSYAWALYTCTRTRALYTHISNYRLYRVIIYILIAVDVTEKQALGRNGSMSVTPDPGGPTRNLGRMDPDSKSTHRERDVLDISRPTTPIYIWKLYSPSLPPDANILSSRTPCWARLTRCMGFILCPLFHLMIRSHCSVVIDMNFTHIDNNGAMAARAWGYIVVHARMGILLCRKCPDMIWSMQSSWDGRYGFIFYFYFLKKIEHIWYLQLSCLLPQDPGSPLRGGHHKVNIVVDHGSAAFVNVSRNAAVQISRGRISIWYRTYLCAPSINSTINPPPPSTPSLRQH